MKRRSDSFTAIVNVLLVASLASLPLQPTQQSRALPGGSDRSLQARTPDWDSALERISAQSLKGRVSFLAADALMGRDTPSAGLDIAAEYIASEFRRAGLDQAGDQGYFQSSEWDLIAPDTRGFRLAVQTPDSVIDVPVNLVSASTLSEWTLEGISLVKSTPEGLSSLGTLEGKGVVLDYEDPGEGQGSRRRELFSRLSPLKPAIVILLGSRREGSYPYLKSLRHPGIPASGRPEPAFPVMTVHDERLAQFFSGLQPGPVKASVALRIPPPLERKAVLRNVVGLLRGADPVLKDSCVLLTAHYDHIGSRPWAEGDNIWNGANDNASGTASVLEVAWALAPLRGKTRRSILFIALFGEEKGLLGAKIYTRSPTFPLERTVAALNLEQLGRVDGDEGDRRSKASLTGFDYSDLGSVLEESGKELGIMVSRDPQNSDAYFSRSDNQAFADLGIPSHTVCVSFDYSDYHRPSDHWEKIDYENMARTNKMIALAVLRIADDRNAPRWNAANPRTVRYVKAWEELQLKDRRAPVPAGAGQSPGKSLP